MAIKLTYDPKFDIFAVEKQQKSNRIFRLRNNLKGRWNWSLLHFTCKTHFSLSKTRQGITRNAYSSGCEHDRLLSPTTALLFMFTRPVRGRNSSRSTLSPHALCQLVPRVLSSRLDTFGSSRSHKKSKKLKKDPMTSQKGHCSNTLGSFRLGDLQGKRAHGDEWSRSKHVSQLKRATVWFPWLYAILGFYIHRSSAVN